LASVWLFLCVTPLSCYLIVNLLKRALKIRVPLPSIWHREIPLPTARPCGKVQNGENHRFTYSASPCGHRPVLWSAHVPSPSPSLSPEASAKNKSAPPWPRHTSEGVLGPSFFHTAKARYVEGDRKKVVTRTITLACRIGRAAERKTGCRAFSRLEP
jgi:hypothetical protein